MIDDPRLYNPSVAESAARWIRIRRRKLEWFDLENAKTILIPEESDGPRRRTMKELLEERGER